MGIRGTETTVKMHHREGIMKRAMRTRMLSGLFVLLLLAGCAVSESFKVGQDLSGSQRWDEAIIYFQKAVSEAPDNPEYKNALENAKREAAKIHLERARQLLAAASPEITVPALEQVLKEADIAAGLDPQNKTVVAFKQEISGEMEAVQGKLKSLYSQADLDMQKEDWPAALTKLKQVNKLFPNYEDTGNRLVRSEQEAVKSLYQQGIALGKQEEWKLAAQVFKAAVDINPNYYDLSTLAEQAKSRDNVQYYLTEADKAGRAQNWDRAIVLYEKALEYQPENQELAGKMDGMKAKVGQLYFDEAVKFMNQGKYYPAMKRVERIRTYAPGLQDDPIFKEFLRNFCKQLMERADKYTEKELWGNALVWLQKVEAINPSYPELFQKVLDTKDRINKRLKKSIAVFDFSSPSNDKDAGKIAANKLITFLHKSASGDLRIIERENLQSILREMQLGQTGLVDVKSVQNVGKMRGIDTFIMGDVLHFSARTTDMPSLGQVKVLVNEEDVRNPEFSDWLMMNPKPNADDLKHAPPRTVKKKDYQFISYKQGSSKVSAIIEISYKLVDTLTGENIFTNTISGRLIKEDKYQDGVAIANIAHDPLELPTEVEVLDELTNEKISEMGQSVLKHYQSLEVEYFNQGQQQQKRRNIDQAVERYTDAVYDEKLKGISTPISQKSMEFIDKLAQDK